MDQTKVAIRASTQQHLDIEAIQDDLVVLKDGGCCLVITTTAINFGLLSEKEQEAIIYAYAGLLNSLTFPIQIVIRSQKKDISAYIRLIEEAEAKTQKAAIKEQIRKYRAFIQETVQKNEVLDKKFYIAIPMSALELGIAKNLTATLKSRRTLPFEKAYILEQAKTNLYPKRDHLLRLLARLGLKSHQLTTQELIQLFFNIYNPESPSQQMTQTEQYQGPLVQTMVTTPKEENQPSESSSIRQQIDSLVQESVEKKTNQ